MIDKIIGKMRIYLEAGFYVLCLFFSLYGAFGLGVGILDDWQDSDT